MKRTRKLLALLLCLCLLAGCFAALADEEPESKFDEASGTLTVKAGDVTEISSYGDGVGLYTGEEYENDEDVPSSPWITVNGTNVVGGDNPQIEDAAGLEEVDITVGNVDVAQKEGSYGIYADNGDPNITAKITVNGNVATEKEGVCVYNTEVIVNGSVTSAKSIAVDVGSGGSVTVNNGSVTGGEDGDGINVSGTGTVTVNNGNVTGGDNGIYAEDNSTVIVTGKVTGTGDDGIETYGSSKVTVTGDVEGNYGIYAHDASTVTVTGNVTGKYDGILAYDASAVAVTGNVTATGEYGVGADLTGYYGEDESKALDVLVEGTVSGGQKAIEFNGTFDGENYDFGGVSLTVWKATPDANGSVAQLYDEEYGLTIDDCGNLQEGGHGDEDNTYAVVSDMAAYELSDGEPIEEDAPDKEKLISKAREALKDAIHYIIKISENEKALTSAVGEKGTTHAAVAEGETWQTAVADEWVKLGLNLAEGQVLDGVYYHEDDEKALTTADAERMKQENGSYWVKMLRGGGMLLALKSHCGHSKTKTVTLEEGKVAPTCEKDGSHIEATVCAYCGEELSRKTVTDKATGHSFTKYVSDDNAKCEEDGTETAECDHGCGKKDTRTIKGSATGHSFTKYVSDNNAKCEEDGTETAECDHGCGKKDTRTVKGSATDHDWGEPTYTWSADNKTVTARCVCKNDPSHVLEETVTATATVTRKPTANSRGETTYTATFSNPAFTVQSKTVRDVKKLKPAAKQLVYTETPEWRGLRSADRTPMGEALKTIARSIENQKKSGRSGSQSGGQSDGEEPLTVRMWYLDEGVLVPEELLEAFNALSLEDRLLILMDQLDCGEPEGLSEDGQAVLDDIYKAIADMTDDERAARQADMDKHFLPRSVTVDGVEHASVCIELEIEEGEKLSYERYTFFEDGGSWKLFKIETGEYK